MKEQETKHRTHRYKPEKQNNTSTRGVRDQKELTSPVHEATILFRRKSKALQSVHMRRQKKNVTHIP